MNWPFVSRARFEDQHTELARVREELATERDRGLKMWNWITFRGIPGGMAFDPSLLPVVYQPKIAAPAQPRPGDDAEKMAQQPRNARKNIALFEVKRQQELERLEGRPQEPPKQQQQEMAARLKQEGTGD